MTLDLHTSSLLRARPLTPALSPDYDSTALIAGGAEGAGHGLWHSLAVLMAHLKRGAAGNLLHGPAGHLVRDCAGGGCACVATPGCSLCPDATPARFHVTFVDVALCEGCVDCPDAGVSLQVTAGSVLNGTYLLTRDGLCAWTASSSDVSCSASLFGSADCTGSSSAIEFAIQLVRINSTQFLLQVTDDTNTILLFDAVVDAANCCASFTEDNSLTTCGCVTGDETIITLATGGSATVTPC